MLASSSEASNSSWTVKWTIHAQFMSFETDKTVKMNGILLRRHPNDQRRHLKDHRRHPKDQKRRPKDQRRHHLRINVLMSNTSIYVVVCVFNLVWMNLVHPWIFDFFGIIFASLIEENSLNIGRMRLRFCPKMENGCTYLNFFRALFTKRIGSYDHFRFFRENLIIWEST